MSTPRAVIVGGGMFGLGCALELSSRGHAVTLFDRGPIPHPLAESTDISKAVRADYGADEAYTALGESALEGWRRWNEERRTQGEPPLFHETGVTFLSRTAMQPGGFELESYTLLRKRGHALERLDAAAIAARFPAYRPGVYQDGYFNPIGGWAAASDVVRFLAERARSRGIAIHERAVSKVRDDGVVVDDKAISADLIVVCAGAWVPHLVPELAGSLRANGQPIFHLKPDDPAPFAPERFPVFGADIARTGYYGFPANRDGIVKVANHGTGIEVHDDADRFTREEQEAALRAFLHESFPALASAPLVHSRLCAYADSVDGNFWIARHPARPNLVVATGGSGHAFKFAPVLGALIADVAQGIAHPLVSRFRWRPELSSGAHGDAARHTS